MSSFFLQSFHIAGMRNLIFDQMPRLWQIFRIFTPKKPFCCGVEATDFATGRLYTRFMKTVYADSLILLNAAVDYLLLLSTGKLCGLPLRRGRMLLGSLWGGAYALFAVLWPEYFALLTVKLFSGALAVVVAFGWNRRTFRAVVAFCAVSAAFAGTLYGAASLTGYDTRHGLYFPVSPRLLLLSFAACYAGISLIFRCAGRRAERRLHMVEITLDGRQAALSALEDSGNELIDPVTGSEVLVAGAEALSPLFDDPAPLRGPDPLSALEAMNARHERPRFRLLPCSGAAAGRTLLLCFTPDAVTVNGTPRKDLTVAVSPNALSGDGKYQAIL